jgi:hypothetical protein
MAVTIQHIRPVAHLPLVLGVVRKLNIAELRPYLEKILPRQRGVEGLDWGFRLFCHPSSA